VSEPLYLSKVIFDAHDRLARADLASPYEMHRTLMNAFADGSTTEQTRLLFRVEPSVGDGFEATVLAQALVLPDWSFLEHKPGVRLAPPVKVFDPPFAAGQTFRFRLRANPVVSRMSSPGAHERGKRLGLIGEDAQRGWLQRHGERGGFAVESVRITQEGNILCTRGEHRTSHASALFDGLLRVTDAAALRRALSLGIGPAKAFGFGLLSLAPA